MFLEKLQIKGFKSFANKNELKFPGLIEKASYGITAVVGPNGSGKSNVADAVRWVLGEQSIKTLRGKKSEDVIFSGSDKKNKSGMAEVSLYLNNEDKRINIAYSQIVLTRRLFRTGESEYLINNSKVRLSDIQILLAKANFGQKTYSVIGQGMVDRFLNTSLAERKEFFDEATGVKQFQIKRDTSLNKLKVSYENLSQINLLLTEIKPRLHSLTRQVNKLKKREKLKKELYSLQKKYYRNIWHKISKKFNKYNQETLQLEKKQREKNQKLNFLNKELRQIELKNNEDFKTEELKHKLEEIQKEKEKINNNITRLNVQLEIKLENIGKFDLAWLNNKKQSLEKDLLSLQNKITKNNFEIKEKSKQILNLKEEKNDIYKEQKNLEEKLFLLEKKNKEKNYFYQKLNNIFNDISLIGKEKDILLIHKTIKEIKNKILKLLNEIKSESQKNIKSEKVLKLEKYIVQNKKKQEEQEQTINKIKLEILNKKEENNFIKNNYQKIKQEIETIKEKLKQNKVSIDYQKIEKEKNELNQKNSFLEKKYNEIKNELDKKENENKKDKVKLFSLQRNIQSIQTELNNLNNILNEKKLKATRYGTKLENIELEIRRNFGDLKKIKEKEERDYIEIDNVQKKINQIKNQLELIGGIDPEVEKEYSQIKNRFEFLSEQVNDLKETIKSLENIVKELDYNIKKHFDKEFKIISSKFEEYFKILFNGGKAKIIKVLEEKLEIQNQDNDSHLNKIKFLKKHNSTGLAGIEIQATPPGKKIKSISMLSGGERALIAIALICAIISANPAPFVVLDEVDAALDEANSERFAKILDDLSHKTQFIVITHNRASMAKANIIYGITMGDDGVSKLLSIKLEDYKKEKNVKTLK